ncbi:unnamed protein product [Prorocentrum cordatum]|uniref:Uncharacterized protein n=1 Tax=Prorocentrum cordatum TaxID=2364126 RepID=A0ABN9RMK4_9DINO|nr:unnamed protein product [Polarella glacialis]
MYIYIHTWLKVSRDRRRPPKAPFGRLSFCQLCTSADGMMRRCTSHSVGALLLLLVARGAPSARSPASGTLARPRLEGSASGRPREPQAEFGRRQATSGAQLLKLLAGDGVAWNGFGKSVAVSSDGARVVVGADCYYNDDRAGSAYVLDGATGERLLKLVASDGAVSDKFGISVAVSSDGARVVVGASGDDSNTGAAYVLHGTTGERLLKLVASDGAPADLFGCSVAVSSDGARVVVGATGDETIGSAYVLDGTTGERLLKLVASDGAPYDRFGVSVAVSSDGARVVVGASTDDDQGDNSGAAYVFDGTTGERLLKLVASDGTEYHKFGNSVAVSSDGARVVVGAYYDDDQGDKSGAAYVFDFIVTTETETTATTTTDTGTSSATSSATTIIKTTTETTTETTTATTTETTTATTTKTATTTTDTGTSSDTSNNTATTEPWGLIVVVAGVLILFLVCGVALGCLVTRGCPGRGRSPTPERGIDNAEVEDNESQQVAEI